MPTSGPSRVYYNPDVDIVLITEGLKGLPITSAHSGFDYNGYTRQLGYNLSRIQTLSMLWSFTGAACPVTSGHPRDFSLPPVEMYSRRIRADAAYSMELGLWVNNFFCLAKGEDGVTGPLPRRIALLDILNVRRIMSRYVGLGIDLISEKPGERWNEAARWIPNAFIASLFKEIGLSLYFERVSRDMRDPGLPLELDVFLCRIRIPERWQGIGNVLR